MDRVSETQLQVSENSNLLAIYAAVRLLPPWHLPAKLSRKAPQNGVPRRDISQPESTATLRIVWATEWQLACTSCAMRNATMSRKCACCHPLLRLFCEKVSHCLQILWDGGMHCTHFKHSLHHVTHCYDKVAHAWSSRTEILVTTVHVEVTPGELIYRALNQTLSLLIQSLLLWNHSFNLI